MEKKNYPQYHAGQILTSDNLNDSFLYLDEQDRISRRTLTGHGIFNGLDYNYNPAQGILKIYPGTAITTDGYIIDYKETVVYKHLVKYEADIVTLPDKNMLKDAYLFFETADQVDALGKKTTVITDISKYAFGIIIDLVEELSVRCNQQSCDINNSQISVVYRPILININSSNLQTANNFYTQLLSVVKTKRLVKILESRDLNLLNEKVLKLYNINRDMIVNALKELLTLANNQGSLLNKLMSEQKINLSNPVDTLKSMAENRTEIPSYYLLFLEDLKTAINEFVLFYNSFIYNYPFYSFEDPKKRLIVLGTGTTTFARDLYRSVFRFSTPNQQQVNDHNILSRLFIRIQKLIDSFLGTKVSTVNINSKFSVNTVNLIPGHDSTAKLEERSIPYYYNYSEISSSWYTFYPVPDLDLYHYKIFSDGIYENNLDKCPFFRLEGYYNAHINEVYERVNDLIEKYDLPVKVAKMELKKLSYVRQDYKDLLSSLFKLSKESKLVPKVASSTGFILSKENKPFNNFTLNDFKSVKKLITDFNDAINFNANYDIRIQRLNISPVQLVKAHDILTNINAVKFENYFYTLCEKEQVLPADKMYKEPGIAAFNILRTMINQMYIKNYKPAEYLGGVFKYDTLVLLYYNDRVIMDLNMPGYIEDNPEKPA